MQKHTTTFIFGIILLGFIGCVEKPNKATSVSTSPTKQEVTTASKQEKLAEHDFVRSFETPTFARSVTLGNASDENVVTIHSIFERYLPKKETFEINPLLPSSIRTESGTIIDFAPGSFMDSLNQMVMAPVTLQVEEYNEFVEFAAANLVSQTTKNELLETGGMYYITATSSGNTVQLNPDLPATMHIPYNGTPLPDMHTYYGEKTNDVVQWNDADSLVRPNCFLRVSARNSSAQKATQSGITEITNENWMNLLEKQAIDDTPLAKYLATNDLELELKFSPFGKPVFFVGDNRTPKNLVRDLAELIERLPALDRYSMSSEYFKGSVFLTFSTSETKCSHQYTNPAKRKTGDERFEHVTNLSNELVGLYTMNISQLGWINCDHFAQKITSSRVKFKIPERLKNVVVWVVIPGLMSIVKGQWIRNEIQIENYPINLKARVIAMGEENDIPVMSIYEGDLDRNNEIETRFTRFQYADLETIFDPRNTLKESSQPK